MTEMTFRRVGRSGLTVSVAGLGCNNLGMRLDARESAAVVAAALEHGVTLFDTADAYGASEQRLGQALAGHRDDVVIATKFGSDVTRRGNTNGTDWGARGARRYVVRAVESSLRRLDTDWIDLLQMHRPDPLTPIEETLSALDDLVHAGKVRYLGHSNFAGWQTAHAEWVARTRGLERFVSAQNEYNLIDTGIEDDLVPALEEYGIGLLPYFPLASGLLTGKYRRGEAPPADSRITAWNLQATLTDAAFDRVEALQAFAAQAGCTLLDVALGGLAARPAVASVIAGATTPDQVAANVRAALWTPTAAQAAALADITSA
jgi:aryl-alcohol dehydrogenase-like predicted oxidoreductase